MKRTFTLFLSISLLFILFSFTQDQGGDLPNFLSEKFVEIESGEVHLFESPKDDTRTPLIKKVSSFHISKFEVTNQEYTEFLEAIEKVGNKEFYELVRIDTSKWMNRVPYPDRFMEHYHKHSAYSDYPVVNISHEGAKAYCDWLSTKVSNSLPEGQKVSFRLPTKEEWLRASRGDNHGYSYAWGDDGAYNSNGIRKCNFKETEKEEVKNSSRYTNRRKKTVVVGTMKRLKSNVSVTKPVESFEANPFGLYNLNGNVAEMIKENNIALGGSWADLEEDVTLESELEYKGASPFVGFRPVMIMN